jgi:hypothetical protein
VFEQNAYLALDPRDEELAGQTNFSGGNISSPSRDRISEMFAAMGILIENVAEATSVTVKLALEGYATAKTNQAPFGI